MMTTPSRAWRSSAAATALQGISRLVEGMKAEDAIARMRGIRCGFKNTSCPDQLAIALGEALAQDKQ